MAHFIVYNTSDSTRTDTPLGAGVTQTIDTIQTQQEGAITGTVFTDQAGNLLIDHSMDGGLHWDYTDTVAVTASTGAKINLPVIGTSIRVRFDNTAGASQTVLRIFVRTFGTKTG